MTMRTLTFEVGNDNPMYVWRLLFEFVQGEPAVLVKMHWHDKDVPTHVFEVDATELQDGLTWARQKKE